MRERKCSECGAVDDVKPASQYPELRVLLAAWGSLETSGSEMLCPDCAETVSEQMRGKTVRICRLDPTRPARPEDEEQRGLEDWLK